MSDPTINSNLNTVLTSPYCVAAMIPGRHPQLSAVGSDGILRVANPIRLTGRPPTEWVGVDNGTDLPAVTSHTISTSALAAGKPSVRKVGDVGGRRMMLRPRPGEMAVAPFDYRANAAGQGFTVLALVKTSALAVTARFLSIGNLTTDKFITFNCEPNGGAGLEASADTSTALNAEGLSTAKKQGVSPEDVLTDQMEVDAKPHIDAVLGRLEAMIAAATSFDELRAMISEAFADIPVDDLARALAAGLAVAQIGGRADAAEDVRCLGAAGIEGPDTLPRTCTGKRGV